MRPFDEIIQKRLLYAGLIALAIGPVFYFIISALNLNGKCHWLKYLGIYCPACGGTRAFGALIHGDIIKSLLLHPVVLYAALILGTFTITTAIYYLRGKNGRRFKMRPVYLIVGIGIFLSQWIIKNILLLFFGISIL